ncbi:uncharacterized protein [Nicotiana sylvestris]|uniref:uncharacterized protein n=1 Tax=Nicotiana sylvestris TaxID=4096 RepID=UPI00388C9116
MDISPEEIDEAIRDMTKEKAPGVDGFPIEFFTKQWETVKQDIYEDVSYFFHTGRMMPAWNYTAITLIPKIPPPSKVVAKIVTRRIKKLIEVAIGKSQSAFIEGRSTIDNILFSHELFKGYNRKGLQANADKSSKSIAGVHQDIKVSLLNLIGYTEGSIPFKYLGVPLSAKKLNIHQCLLLVEKITKRVNCWSTRMLSYSGRVQLINFVLFGIQTHCAQIFILPKKIMKMIETICRTFLWTGSSATSRKALIA